MCKTLETPQATWAPVSRRLVPYDIENIAGTGRVTATEVRQMRSHAQFDFKLSEYDQVVIGASGSDGLLAVAAGWPGVRCVFKAGHDGADQALLEVIREDVAGRFDEIVLFSGDGIFAEEIMQLTALGVKTTIVARHSHCAHQLINAATNYYPIPENIFYRLIGLSQASNTN